MHLLTGLSCWVFDNWVFIQNTYIIWLIEFNGTDFFFFLFTLKNLKWYWQTHSIEKKRIKTNWNWLIKFQFQVKNIMNVNQLMWSAYFNANWNFYQFWIILFPWCRIARRKKKSMQNRACLFFSLLYKIFSEW